MEIHHFHPPTLLLVFVKGHLDDQVEVNVGEGGCQDTPLRRDLQFSGQLPMSANGGHRVLMQGLDDC